LEENKCGREYKTYHCCTNSESSHINPITDLLAIDDTELRTHIESHCHTRTYPHPDLMAVVDAYDCTNGGGQLPTWGGAAADTVLRGAAQGWIQ
jgi:hypothetical protein